MGVLYHKNIPYGGGGGTKAIPISSQDYEALSESEKNDPNKMYFINDVTVTGVDIDDTTTALNKVWSSSKVSQSISNRNLLDNPWFTVNQRGQSSYAGNNNFMYTLDRWASVISPNSAIEKTDNGIDITIDAGSSDNAFAQILDDNGKAIEGRIVTLSAIINGSMLTGTLQVFALPSSGWKVETFFNVDGIKGELARRANGTTQIVVRCPKNGNTYNIRAVKLEVGSISTLAMDTAPNYATELLKCQRYFINHIGDMISGQTYQQTANFLLPLPIKMRTTPVVTVNSKGNIVTMSGTLASWTTMSVIKNLDNGLYVRCALDNTSGDAFYPCNMGLVDVTLSADL